MNETPKLTPLERELYEALEDMMHLVGRDITGEHYDEACARVARARRALAKARGLTPETHTPDGAHVQVSGETVDGGAETGSEAK